MAQEVRGWYTRPGPLLGHDTKDDWYGFLVNLSELEARLVLRVDEPSRVALAIAEAQAGCGDRRLSIWVDDRSRARVIGPSLMTLGWRQEDSVAHLALVGEIRALPGPEGLQVAVVGDVDLAQWARVKLQCFSDSEDNPTLGALAVEMAHHRRELNLARHHLALLDGEPVAVLAHYAGQDQFVFNLGTRLPFRRRGIAQAMLARWVSTARAEGCRAMLINASEAGRPAALYRRLGFTDDVYWYQRYALPRDK